ncbi:hypothetical protein J4466_01185 [Candidatus Pacearchaeota archaeon]|nr:hypothetical protein [Candidatus Pacearchaeota archaeon]
MAIFGACYSFLFMVSQKAWMAGNLDLKEAFLWIFRAIFILIMLYVAYQVLKAIFGGTWAAENIIIAGMGIILAGLFVIVGFLVNQGRTLGMLEERTRNIGKSLSDLGNDFKGHLSKHKY